MDINYEDHPLNKFLVHEIRQNDTRYEHFDDSLLSLELFINIASTVHFTQQGTIKPLYKALHLDVNNYKIITENELPEPEELNTHLRPMKYPRLINMFLFKGSYFQKMANFFVGFKTSKSGPQNTLMGFYMPKFSQATQIYFTEILPRIVDLQLILGPDYRAFVVHNFSDSRLHKGVYQDQQIITFPKTRFGHL